MNERLPLFPRLAAPLRLGLGAVLLLAGAPVPAHGQAPLDELLRNAFTYRNLGPFRAGAWVSDIAVPDRPARAHLYTLYIATRTGGLWKSTNNGTTFEPIFDETGQPSIGDVAVAPSDPEIVWVGTGDPYNARSSYYGNGVYKSEDGGETWRHMGLPESHHIARIVIHPTDPDIVYVAAMGHLFSRNEERGVFKTIDGGRTWAKVLYVNDRVGAIDLVMNPADPAVLYAAMYDKERFPWHLEAGGPESGIYKTTDGGASWARLGGGLPEGDIGRIGLNVFRANPDIVYAVVENVNLREPTPAEIEAARQRGREPRPRIIGGEVYRSDDAGRSWRKMNSAEDDVGGKAAYSFNQIRVDPVDDRKVYVTTITIANSTDGGRTWYDIDWPPRRLFSNMFGDVRALWVDPQDPDRIIAGTDGTIHISYDGGRTSDYLYNIPLGEVYAVGVDMDDPYHIYAGLQDHESWKGPINSWSGAVGIEDWITVGTSDGMYNQVDPTDSRWLYNTYQFGGHYRVDQVLGTRVRIEPRRGPGEPPLRYNWTPPIEISPHDPRTIYTGAQVLLRSRNRGDDWEEISPDLTTNDPVKIAGQGSITYCTITTISESPVTAGVIWVGTDDGRVHVTRDAGGAWTDVTSRIAAAGGPDSLWVSRVFASHHREGTAYVTKSGYRRDIFRPFVYRTDDFGATWRPITNGLPDLPVSVIYEDAKNPELLFAGTDRGVYVSIDGGAQWVPLRGNMPPVVVSDLVVHPRENDLVVGTYGRGIWVTDIVPLQELTPDLLARRAHLFSIEAKGPRVESGWGNYALYGDRHVTTPNEPNGLRIYYYLRDPANRVTITVSGRDGAAVRELQGATGRGIHDVVWNFRGARGGPVEPGEYVVALEVDGERFERPARVLAPVHLPRPMSRGITTEVVQ